MSGRRTLIFMAFRNYYRIHDSFQMRLFQIGQPALLESDPCLNCTLPICSEESGGECQYIAITGRRVERGTEKVDLSTLTPEEKAERIRTQKREHMRRVRAKEMYERSKANLSAV